MSWENKNKYLPVRKSGIETKNPEMAQTLVEAAPFKYLLVLKNEKLFYDLQSGRLWQ